MVVEKITRSPKFIKQTKSLDLFLLKKLKAQFQKITQNPEAGNPLKYLRGERSFYIKPFRLIYSVKDDELFPLKFEHRKKAYK